MATKYFCDLCGDEVDLPYFSRDKVIKYQDKHFEVRGIIRVARDDQGRDTKDTALCDTHAGDLLSLLT